MMQLRAGAGWQYAMTDLSLILFLVAASGLSHSKTAARPVAPAAPPLVADPVAVWRPGAGMPSLAAWLATQPRDPRQRLTVIARFVGSDSTSASAQAAALLGSAQQAGWPVRIVVEPAPADDLSAALTWDAAPEGVL